MTGSPEPAHPDFGRLIRDVDADLVVCHVCGRGYRSLGCHLRAHEMTAAEYRDQFGLMRSRPLSSRSASSTRSDAQRGAYRSSPRMRADFAVGQDMARAGQLQRESRRSFEELGVSPELSRERLAQLAAGRRHQNAMADASLAARVGALGQPGLRHALQALYVLGDLSQEATARAMGVGNERLRDLLRAHAIPLRAVGRNSAAGKRARVSANDRETASHVGTDDIVVWLRQERAGSATLAVLAARTGRSIPWVTSRLRR
ncbi:MucR family transcriptional regulator [Kitasatospora sp. NPDC098663]|uniref:MucR family transcriptional regulator n=1 Tax=Kitasatospora sp. NPDC098663 TaxID=3364096 RepID=UPI0038093742